MCTYIMIIYGRMSDCTNLVQVEKLCFMFEITLEDKQDSKD